MIRYRCDSGHTTITDTPVTYPAWNQPALCPYKGCEAVLRRVAVNWRAA